MNTTALERPAPKTTIEVTPPTSPHPVFGTLKLRPVTFWLPDPNDPEAIEWARQNTATAVAAMKQSEEEREVDRWCEAAFAESLKDEPPYDWGEDEP